MLSIHIPGGETVPLDLDDYYIQGEWQGWENTVHFRLPAGHPQRKLLQECMTILDQEDRQRYSVTIIDEGRSSADITAQLDLQDLCSTMQVGYSNNSDTAAGTISRVLPVGWSIIDNSGTSYRRTIKLDGARPLDVIQAVTKTYDGLAVQFDNNMKTVTLYDPTTERPSGAYFTDELNLTESPQYKGKAKNLYTRLYAQGKGGLTFADINEGKPYVDCFDYTDRVICRFWKDERYTDPESLKRAAETAVKKDAVPARSYECSVVDLASIDPEHYAFLRVRMYQAVTLMDRVSKTRIQHQIARYCRHPQHPERNKVTLSTVPGTVSSHVAEVHDAIEDTAGLTPFTQRWQAMIGAIVDSVANYNGGNLVFTQNDDGKDSGLMIMDTDDPRTAQKILWLNLKGMLYSDQGIAGFDNPDPSKITVWSFEKNGFAANWIKTGSLDANLIKVGILEDAVGKNRINMETGEAHLECETLTIKGKTPETIAQEQAGVVAQEKAEAAKQEAIQAALNDLNAYKNTVTGSLSDLQGQIDGSISTWFAAEIPTTTNYPANGWYTDDEKNKHLGDLYYVVDNATYGGQVYRWAMVSWYYQWVRVEDTELAKALADAAKAQDTADGKRRVFVTEPKPPYDVGDLWAQGTNGDLMVCRTARASGYYYYADWQKATDYVDSQAAGDIAQDKIDDLTQQQVFDKLTNNGTVQGLFMRNGQLYINASYLATGILSAIRIQSKDAKSFWDLEQNLLKMHGEFSTDSGKYNMTMWAAMLTLLEGSNLRSRLRTEGDPYGNGRGYLQVFAGEATDNGLGANGKSTSVSPEAIEVGRVQSGALTGKVAVDTVQASRVTMSGQQVLSNEGGYRTGQFDKLALGSGLPYGVRWKWSPALGCYVLVSDQRPTFVTYTKTVDVTQAERPNWGDNYVDVTVPEGINLVQLSEFSPGVSYGTCETTVTIYRNGAEYFILKNTRCEYTGYGQNRQDILSYDAGDVKPGDVLRLRLRAQFNPDVSGAATSTASITYTFRGAESDEPVEEATAGNQNTAEIDPEGRNIKQERM